MEIKKLIKSIFYCKMCGHQIKNCKMWMANERNNNNHQGNHVTNDSKLLIASLSTSIDLSNNIWYIDWGPTRYITRNKSYFSSFQQNEDDEFVYLGDYSKHNSQCWYNWANSTKWWGKIHSQCFIHTKFDQYLLLKLIMLATLFFSSK
jgi:hypothetical protein